LKKSYIYSNTSQILAQRKYAVPIEDYDDYFYVTDRLGSVRQVVDNAGSVILDYTYSPFGQMLEQSKAAGYEYTFNSFLFTGQWYDSEIAQYYLRARMYDPVLMRFTGRDPVKGRPNKPMELHAYLYCANDSVNRIDPSGESYASVVTGGIIGGYAMHSAAIITTAIGVANDNDSIISLGIAMERLVGVAIVMGMIQGGGLPAIDALEYAGAAGAYGMIKGGGALVGAVLYLAHKNPTGFMDFIVSAFGNPDLPNSVGGAAGTLINYIYNEIDE
jgi:RHS repeat-associated protein